MKKVILLAVALVSLATITSCSKDDDASLQGKWVEFKTGELVNGQEVLEDVVPDNDGCQQDYTQITANSTISHDFDDLGNGCEEIIGDPNPYTRDGNIITFDDGTAEIKSLTGSTLKLYSVYDIGGGPQTFITVLKRI
ncbi:MAG: hypothetical protein ACOYLP_05780 [Flavobacterium sp.]|uniref:hypothetical protein n=1 Tax=Flavobacterium sp. TaxID=239 RepID=UPI003BCF352C